MDLTYVNTVVWHRDVGGDDGPNPGCAEPWLHPWRALLRYAVPLILVFVLYHSVPVTLTAVWGLLTGGWR